MVASTGKEVSPLQYMTRLNIARQSRQGESKEEVDLHHVITYLPFLKRMCFSITN